jgi:hypothetical protein
MRFQEAVNIMYPKDEDTEKNPDELQYCIECRSDNIGYLTWMSSGEPTILSGTGITKCMDCGGKNFLLKEQSAKESFNG